MAANLGTAASSVALDATQLYAIGGGVRQALKDGTGPVAIVKGVNRCQPRVPTAYGPSLASCFAEPPAELGLIPRGSFVTRCLQSDI